MSHVQESFKETWIITYDKVIYMVKHGAHYGSLFGFLEAGPLPPFSGYVINLCFVFSTFEMNVFHVKLTIVQSSERFLTIKTLYFRSSLPTVSFGSTIAKSIVE